MHETFFYDVMRRQTIVYIMKYIALITQPTTLLIEDLTFKWQRGRLCHPVFTLSHIIYYTLFYVRQILQFILL